ncbi:MAG: nuclear transport factor 2 family protein, partial [Acidobacteria bacterium]|nr:nuclear transport factor 2 family protein [Acidobacteriota bacterium]
AQTPPPSPEEAVRQVLVRQQQAWNRGEVREFMEGYDKTDAAFVGTTVSRGYDRVLARYLERYPTPEAMGTLTFSGLEIRMLGSDYASVIGRFRLKRDKSAGGDKTGLFTLLFRKTAAGWKIILDHTV